MLMSIMRGKVRCLGSFLSTEICFCPSHTAESLRWGVREKEERQWRVEQKSDASFYVPSLFLLGSSELSPPGSSDLNALTW